MGKFLIGRGERCQRASSVPSYQAQDAGCYLKMDDTCCFWNESFFES